MPGHLAMRCGPSLKLWDSPLAFLAWLVLSVPGFESSVQLNLPLGGGTSCTRALRSPSSFLDRPPHASRRCHVAAGAAAHTHEISGEFSCCQCDTGATPTMLVAGSQCCSRRGRHSWSTLSRSTAERCAAHAGLWLPLDAVCTASRLQLAAAQVCPRPRMRDVHSK